VAELSRKHGNDAPDDRPRVSRYSAGGHPSIEQLMVEQGTGPISDPAMLHGDFWPEEEAIEDFLSALHEWRGHSQTEPAP
jgi:hypothetical protein